MARYNQPLVEVQQTGGNSSVVITPSSEMPITGVFGTGRVQLFPKPGTYTFTVPDAINSVRVRLWGGGGCYFEGTYPSGDGTYYSAGNGGGFSMKTIAGLIPGQQITVTVGRGGYTSEPNSRSGTSSSFGVFFSATGGGASPRVVGEGIGGDINYRGGQGDMSGQGGGGGAAGLFGDGGDGGGNGNAPTTGSTGGGGGTFYTGSGSVGGSPGAPGFTGEGGWGSAPGSAGQPGTPGLVGLDYIATGGGGASSPFGSSVGGGNGANGGGGGNYANGGFPGGGSGRQGSKAGNGLVIVEY